MSGLSLPPAFTRPHSLLPARLQVHLSVDGAPARGGDVGVVASSRCPSLAQPQLAPVHFYVQGRPRSAVSPPPSPHRHPPPPPTHTHTRYHSCCRSPSSFKSVLSAVTQKLFGRSIAPQRFRHVQATGMIRLRFTPLCALIAACVAQRACALALAKLRSERCVKPAATRSPHRMLCIAGPVARGTSLPLHPPPPPPPLSAVLM